MSQGYMKPQFNGYEERKVERDLTPKEKKLFEQNLNFYLDRIKNLKLNCNTTYSFYLNYKHVALSFYQYQTLIQNKPL